MNILTARAFTSRKKVGVPGCQIWLQLQDFLLCSVHSCSIHGAIERRQPFLACYSQTDVDSAFATAPSCASVVFAAQSLHVPCQFWLSCKLVRLVMLV